MKKFIILLAVVSASFVAQAQNPVTKYMTTTLTGSVDSVRSGNTTPAYLYVAPTQSYKCASVQTSSRRTTAAQGGTIFLQGSNDNSTWFTFSPNGSSSDTVTIANSATSTGSIIIPSSKGIPYKYLRAKIAQASTDTAYVKALIHLR